MGFEGAYSKSFIMVSTMLEVDANGPYRFGSKGLQVLRMKKERRRLFREAFDGLDLQFSAVLRFVLSTKVKN